jgi:hypothetical protein
MAHLLQRLARQPQADGQHYYEGDGQQYGVFPAYHHAGSAQQHAYSGFQMPQAGYSHNGFYGEGYQAGYVDVTGMRGGDEEQEQVQPLHVAGNHLQQLGTLQEQERRPAAPPPARARVPRRRSQPHAQPAAQQPQKKKKRKRQAGSAADPSPTPNRSSSSSSAGGSARGASGGTKSSGGRNTPTMMCRDCKKTRASWGLVVPDERGRRLWCAPCAKKSHQQEGAVSIKDGMCEDCHLKPAYFGIPSEWARVAAGAEPAARGKCAGAKKFRWCRGCAPRHAGSADMRAEMQPEAVAKRRIALAQRREDKQKEKRQRKRERKNDGRPKVPPSSYQLFAQQLRPQLVREHPGLTPHEIMRLTGPRWHELSEADRKPCADWAHVLQLEVRP